MSDDPEFVAFCTNVRMILDYTQHMETFKVHILRVVLMNYLRGADDVTEGVARVTFNKLLSLTKGE